LSSILIVSNFVPDYSTLFKPGNKKRSPPGRPLCMLSFDSNNALLSDLLVKVGIIKPKINSTVRNHCCNLIFCRKNSNKIYNWKITNDKIRNFII